MTETVATSSDDFVETTPQIPPPKPPDDPEAWYAPEVRTQYELHPDIVATITQTGDGFDYRVREPPLSPGGEDALATVEDHFADANLARPLTREIGFYEYKSREQAVHSIARFDPN